MPGFCVSCGSPLAGPFCNKCGARAVGSSAPAQAAAAAPSPVQAAPAVHATGAAAKGSGLGKVLLIIGGVVVLLFVIGVGSAVYGVYWVKHKVKTYSAAVTGQSGNELKVVANGNSCRLLSKGDLEQVLGITIEKSAEIVDGDTPGCAYYTNQAAVKQLRVQAAQFAKKQTEEANSRPGPKPDDLAGLLKNTNEMEGIVKTLSLTQPVEDGQIFSFTVDSHAGPDSWAGARLVQAAVPGFEEVQGVGDRAMIGSFGHAFYAQKGNVILYLNTMWVPDARTRGTEISKKIFGNL